MFPKKPLAFGVGVSIFLVFQVFAQSGPTTLELEKPIERELRGGMTDNFTLILDAGQFINLVAEQKGIDVVVRLFGPNGGMLREVDSPNGNQGPEPLVFVTDVAGDYRVQISSLEPDAKPGKYQIEVKEIRTTKLADLPRTKAIAAFADALRLELQNSQASLQAAIAKYLEAANLFHSAEDFSREADALGSIAVIYAGKLGNFELGREYFDKVGNIAQKIGNLRLYGRALRGTGQSFFDSGDFEKGLAYYTRAYVAFEEADDKVQMWQTDGNVGEEYYKRGDLTKMLEYHQKALQIGQMIPGFGGLVASFSRLGVGYKEQGDYFRAMHFQQMALAGTQAANDLGGIARMSINIGNIYSNIGNKDVALDYYQKALELFDKVAPDKKSTGRGASLICIGTVYLDKRNYTEASKFFNEAMTLYESLPQNINTRISIAGVLDNLGQTELELEHYAGALAFFNRAANIQTTIPDKTLLAHSLIGMADIALLQGESDRGLELALQITTIGRHADSREILWRGLLYLGKANILKNKLADAKAALSESIATINGLSSVTGSSESGNEDFLEDKTEPFYEMVSMSRAQNKQDDAFSYAENFKARNLVDVLRTGRTPITRIESTVEVDEEQRLTQELALLNRKLSIQAQSRDSNNERYVTTESNLRKKRLELDEFRSKLFVNHPELQVLRGEIEPITVKDAGLLLPDAKTGEIEFLVGDNKTFLFVITKGTSHQAELKVYELNINKNALSASIEDLRSKIAKGDLGFSNQSQLLFDRLLKPAEAQLAGITNLIIVPDGPLWNLPFQALMEEKGKYLAEKMAVSYAPSLTALREMHKKAKEKKPSKDAELVAFGNPTVNKDTAARVGRVFMDEKLEPLPEAERLVNTLSKMYGPLRSEVYTGAAAREETAKTEVPKYRIVQFATHGILNDVSPMYSHLVLAQDEKDPNEDGLLEAWELKDLDLKADMVILSACDTARGKVSAGEGVIGMTWAAFVAGAPTTVASQWKVESTSTTELMIEFHRQLLTGKVSKAEALRRAQLKLMRNPKYKHPSYWAAWVIVGDAS